MNVAKGDLAYITGCVTQSYYNGRTVSVIQESVSPSNFAEEKFGAAWWIVTANFSAIVQSVRGPKIIEAGAQFSLPDSLLRRIAGPSIDVETETDHPIEVMA